MLDLRSAVGESPRHTLKTLSGPKGNTLPGEALNGSHVGKT